MADQAHDWTDEQIEALERKFNSTYSQAEREMRAKLDEYLKDFDEKNKVWQAEVRAGKATHEQYQGWLKSQSLRREYLSDMCDTLAADASRTNQLAFDMINDKLPRIYAENANYAAYSIESQLHSNTHAFDLVDQSTVRRLMGLDDDGQVIKEVVLTEEEVSPPLRTLRKVNVKKAKDVRWNRQKFNAALTQSILQGESIPNTAKRMARVLNMDKNMAVRAARTAMTSAENAGRVDSYHRAKRIGIDLEQEWLAALDERTRHSHRELDGQHVPVGRKFKVPSSGHELEFPGDPTAHPSEVWNCFIGETTVCSDSQIEKSYCHEYEGELVTIDTATGVHFTCTPNHPILTTSGWVPAKSLHDGDNLLVTGVGDAKVSRGNPHVYHVFPSMKALHELLCILSSKRAAGLSVNFHGDIATSNVEVVAKESLLRLGINTSRFKRVIELALKGTDPLYLGKRPSMEGILRVPLSASRVMRRLRVCASLLWGHGLHADIHGLRASTRLDSSVTEYAIDNLPAETMVRSQLLSGLSGQVLSDEVIGVKVGYTRGTQVYNLQTGNGYYFANQSDNGNFIIAKNCRCTLVAWFPEDGEESAEGRFSRLPKGMTYEQWKAGKAKAVAELKDESGRWANEAGRVSATWYAAKTKGGTAAEGVMLKEALDDYIHGAYEGIVNAANIEIGGFGEFDSVLDADFVASKGKSAFYTAEEAERAKAIVEAIESQEPTSMPVVRTEWRRSAPSEGDELRWGIKSASMDGDFAHKVASGEIEGMNGFLSRGLPSDNGDLLVYHIEGPHRQLDISPLSDYESQQEVLLHGKFEVQRVTEEIYDTGIKTNRAIELTPRQWAEQEGLEIEYFTSKKGKPMARFGTRTYPVDQMDRPSSAFVSGMETDKVTLRHVYIRRTDM